MYQTANVRNNQGQSVIEIMIALAIFSLIAASTVSLALGSFSALTRAEELTKAELLADEGLEAVRTIADNGWNRLVFATTSLATTTDNRWTLNGEGESEPLGNKYTRTIYFYPVYRSTATGLIASSTDADAYLDIFSKLVRVVVSWDIYANEPSRVERNTYLTDWRYGTFSDNDWSGGDGQAVETEPNKFFSFENVDYAATGTIVLSGLSTSTSERAISGYLISSAMTTSNGIWEGLAWNGETPADCPECALKIQIQTTIDNNGAPGEWPLNWCGPTACDDNDYFSTSTGGLIDQSHNGQNWLRYRAVFSGNGSSTPLLKEVKIFSK